MSDTKRTRRSSQRLPKDAQGKAPYPHDTRTLIEESVVWLHGLHEWGELSSDEKKFLRTAKKNLEKMHARRS
jgi:hypothetical protein